MALSSIFVERPYAASISQASTKLRHLDITVDTTSLKKSGEKPGLYDLRCADHSIPSSVTRLLLPMRGFRVEYVGDLTKSPFSTYRATVASPTTMNRPTTGRLNMITLDFNSSIQFRKRRS